MSYLRVLYFDTLNSEMNSHVIVREIRMISGSDAVPGSSEKGATNSLSPTFKRRRTGITDRSS